MLKMGKNNNSDEWSCGTYVVLELVMTILWDFVQTMNWWLSDSKCGHLLDGKIKTGLFTSL